MLTTQDVQNIITAGREVFATKEDLVAFATKDDLMAVEQRLDQEISGVEQRVDQKIDLLTNAVDAYMKKADAYYQEMAVLLHKVQRMEEWIRRVADKVGINYG